MFLILQRGAQGGRTALLPQVEATQMFNRYWYQYMGYGNADAGYGQEQFFVCPCCQRNLPVAFAQADHNFPDSILGHILGGISQNDFQTFANLAQAANGQNLAPNGNQPLGQTSFALPDYGTIQCYTLDNGMTMDELYRGLIDFNDHDADFDAEYEEIPINQFHDGNNDLGNLTYYGLAYYDHSNIAMICAACNQAKSGNLYPAHLPFAQAINQNGALANAHFNVMATNGGDTYTVPPRPQNQDVAPPN